MIADNVGDNVGDIAGLGADLYESYIGAIVATSALAVSAGFGLNGVIVPLAMSAVGVLCSMIGMLFIRTEEHVDQGALLKSLRRGIYIAGVLTAIFSWFVIYKLLGMENIGMYFAVLIGLLAGIGVGLVTEVYTSERYAYTRSGG